MPGPDRVRPRAQAAGTPGVVAVDVPGLYPARSRWPADSTAVDLVPVLVSVRTWIWSLRSRHRRHESRCVVDRDGLAAELKAFRKGRAAQHPHFVQRLGSRLRRLTGITEDDPVPAARAKLRDWIDGSLRDQPADL